jgi:hypothetical protein
MYIYKMTPTFTFFLLLTVIVSFLMNWIYITFLGPSPCSCTKKVQHQKEHDKMTQELGQTNQSTDISDFLDF